MTTAPFTLGFHVGIPFESYAAAPLVNWSTLKAMGRSPAHYREAVRAQRTPRKETTAQRIGRAVHLRLLEPHRFAQLVTCYPGERRAGRDWKLFRQRYRGFEILATEEWELVLSLADAARKNPDVARWLQYGRSELTLIWDHSTPSIGDFEGYSIGMKSRLDFVSEDAFGNPIAILDFKNVRDASPDGFGREAAEYAWAGQSALYQEAFRTLTGRLLPVWLIAIEKSPPYLVQPYAVQGAELEWGRDLFRGLLSRLHHCIQTDEWEGYAPGPVPLKLPHWVLPEETGSSLGLEFDDADEGQPQGALT